VNTVANVLMDPNNFEKCISIIEKLKLSNCPWPIIAKSVHYNGETKYTEEQKNILLIQSSVCQTWIGITL